MVYSKRKIENNFVKESKVEIDKIPSLRFRPVNSDHPLPTIIYYHGWSSNKEYQRFKAHIIASYGYQVIVPDCIYHGERNPIDYEKESMLEKYFPEIILNSIKEAPILIDYIKKIKMTDSKKIAIMGTSMGGFISSGIFTKHQIFKTLIVFNGACAWGELLTFDEQKNSDQNWDYQDELVRYNPADNLDQLNNRPILLLHGDSDSLVPIDAQRYFYNKVSGYYEDKDKIELVEVPRMDHYISTGMLEKAIFFNEEHLK